MKSENIEFHPLTGGEKQGVASATAISWHLDTFITDAIGTEYLHSRLPRHFVERSRPSQRVALKLFDLHIRFSIHALLRLVIISGRLPANKISDNVQKTVHRTAYKRRPHRGGSHG